LKIFVREGERLPKYYGLAYRLFNQHAAVCYPIPLNYVVRVYRDLAFWLRFPNPGLHDRAMSDAYDHGFEEGRKTQMRIDSARFDNEYARGLRDGFHAGAKDGMRIAEEAIMRTVAPPIIIPGDLEHS